MKPKDYQDRCIKEIRQYLEHLTLWRKKAWDGEDWLFDFAEKAWEKAGINRGYLKKKDGLKRPLPCFCLKIPTGGGKTFLAVKTIELVHNQYLKKQMGLVVWITPTLQIYRQTINALRDRDHPYRQHLDMASAGRTLIIEKTDKITPQDISENLTVLMLMLPSASKTNKEALKMFRDSGGFEGFYPSEEDKAGHERLLKQIPNLETFEKTDPLGRKQAKTSLGNTIRQLNALVILDEGHRAYTEMAQKTLLDLNPSMIVELSATPPKESNKLVVIGGQELHKEEMIKLDLHIINKSSNNWRDTIRAAMSRRDDLELRASEYDANANVYIRPICLIQVERTGREQRDGVLIHAEDVRDYLLGQGTPKDWIAVKSAELDQLKEFDDMGGLLSRDCPLRYIITKQALQEGWDCSFAYVLTILTNPHSRTAVTQLVGRILRQPYARKTHCIELDESYVYCFQRTKLLDEIREGFKQEGLEDVSGRVVRDSEETTSEKTITEFPRNRFGKAVENTVLPAFVTKDGKDWRLVGYETDILSRVSWDQVNLRPVYSLDLSLEETRDVEIRAGLSQELTGFTKLSIGDIQSKEINIEYAYGAAHLLDIVPNPWIGYEFVSKVFSNLLTRWKGKEKIVANNFVFILEETRKQLEKERDRLAEQVFNKMLEADEMRFMVIAHDLGMNRLPQKVTENKSAIRATRLDGNQFVLSLFDNVPADSLNELEREVASFLDEQSKLYFWYRNVPRRGHYVQGWQRSKIYADFVFTTVGEDGSDYRKVFVLETKGVHLKNENTAYKRSVFALCNQHAKKKAWNDLVPTMRDKDICYEVVFQDEWQKRLNELFAEARGLSSS